MSSSEAEPLGQAGAPEFLPLSGLQHMVFCDRQAALIHIDGLWADNAYTVEGSHLHRVVDEGLPSYGGGIRVLRGLTLRSRRLGLTGKADVVELCPGPADTGVDLGPVYPGRWALRPVEYKRGKPKAHRADEVQLCAQAICLEEQFLVTVEEGDIYYGQHRRRSVVAFDSELRVLTSEVARRFHALVRSGVIPKRTREKKCDRCSLVDVCMPLSRRSSRSVRAYMSEVLGSLADERGAP